MLYSYSCQFVSIRGWFFGASIHGLTDEDAAGQPLKPAAVTP
jgi:hypothetical protein